MKKKCRQKHTIKMELRRIRNNFAKKSPVGNHCECGNTKAGNCQLFKKDPVE
jgi:hypothetical protein